LGYSFGEENVVRILWNITGKGLHDLHGHWSFFFSDLTIPLDPQTNESSYDKIFSRFKGYALGVCFFFPEVWGGFPLRRNFSDKAISGSTNPATELC
jgi:hypothetical protein